MEQYEYFVPYGGMEVVVGETYSGANIPSTMNAVKLDLGVRQKVNGVDVSARGVRMSINLSGVSPAVPAPTTPKPVTYVLWREGEVFKFIEGAVYTFWDNGSVSFGKLETL